MDRRKFLATLSTWAGVAALASWGKVSFADRKRGGGDTDASKAAGVTLVDPSSQEAKNVHYTEKKADVKDDGLKIDRQGVAFPAQKCATCGFYSNPKKEKGVDVGSCQLFPSKFVKAEAWCQTWNKKT